jgi:D-alanyl-D-alanine carboxypeptidase
MTAPTIPAAAGPVKEAAGGNWSYNNCDYVVAGALLEAVTGKRWQTLVDERLARPLGLKSLGAFPTKRATVQGSVSGRPDSDYDLAAFGAAAGLFGTAQDLLAFDRALLGGKLMSARARAEMWDGQAKLGWIALGQWVFPASLKGCDAPVRIVERRGQIGGVQVRNIMIPEKDVVVIAFVDRAEFEFGEIWQGKGFSFDMLSAAACS